MTPAPTQVRPVCNNKARHYLWRMDDQWKQEWRNGNRHGPWAKDLTNHEAEFPWKAFLSGLPAPSEHVQAAGIDTFGVVYLHGPPQRTAFYIEQNDKTEWIVEPGHFPRQDLNGNIDRTGW